MSKNYLNRYNKRSSRRSRRIYNRSSMGGAPRRTHNTHWNIPRVVAAIACLVGAVVLILLVPKFFSSNNETPDNVASRIKQDENAASGAAAQPTPMPVATPEPTPEHRKKAVALTFDDGPKSEEPDKGIKGTNALLDTLNKYDAHATFFVVGNRCEIDADILKREIKEGHEIGNHSWNHPQLGKLSMKDVNKQLDDTSDIVEEITGYKIKLVRPPYGSVSDAMRKHLDYPMITWDVDTLDWKINTEDISLEKKKEKILKNVKKEVKDGSIILMHDIHETSCEAVKIILPWLQEHDYDVLTVSELMERNGINPKNGKVYASAE
ncbi:MAG: polysaccharide deacetylase family protein [Eubacterium sp.]|nr:polysaccharide deacetylase family protein [Eubacterium sp.]